MEISWTLLIPVIPMAEAFACVLLRSNSNKLEIEFHKKPVEHMLNWFFCLVISSAELQRDDFKILHRNGDAAAIKGQLF